MKLYVLDTDVAGFVQNKHPPVMRHFASLAQDDTVVTTIVTVVEGISGWLPACFRAKNGAARKQALSRWQQTIEFYEEFLWLPFDNAAARIFDELKAQKIRVGTNDLSIASITLAVGGILITRNAVDFQRVPNLLFEDWTISGK